MMLKNVLIKSKKSIFKVGIENYFSYRFFSFFYCTFGWRSKNTIYFGSFYQPKLIANFHFTRFYNINYNHFLFLWLQALKKIAKSKLSNKIDKQNNSKQQQIAQPQQQMANLSLQMTMSELDSISLPSVDVKSIDTFVTYIGEEMCACCCCHCNEMDENQLNENLENEMMRWDFILDFKKWTKKKCKAENLDFFWPSAAVFFECFSWLFCDPYIDIFFFCFVVPTISPKERFSFFYKDFFGDRRLSNRSHYRFIDFFSLKYTNVYILFFGLISSVSMFRPFSRLWYLNFFVYNVYDWSVHNKLWFTQIMCEICLIIILDRKDEYCQSIMCEKYYIV